MWQVYGSTARLLRLACWKVADPEAGLLGQHDTRTLKHWRGGPQHGLEPGNDLRGARVVEPEENQGVRAPLDEPPDLAEVQVEGSA